MSVTGETFNFSGTALIDWWHINTTSTEKSSQNYYFGDDWAKDDESSFSSLDEFTNWLTSKGYTYKISGTLIYIYYPLIWDKNNITLATGYVWNDNGNGTFTVVAAE